MRRDRFAAAKIILLPDYVCYEFRLSQYEVESKINSKAEPTPQLAVSPVAENKPPIYIEKQGEEYVLGIKIHSAQAPSRQIDLKYYVFAPDTSKFELPFSGKLMENDFLIPNVERTLKIRTGVNLDEQGGIFIALIGKFSKESSGNQFIQYQEAFGFDVIHN